MAAPRNDDVKKQILDAAQALLETTASADLSLSAIAEKAHVSKGTLYYHFPNKEDLLFALMDRYLEEQQAELDAWTSNTSKDTSLPRLVKYVLQRDTENVGIRLHFIYEATEGNEHARQRLLERYEHFAEEIGELIAERNPDIDAEYASWLILILSDGLLIHKNLKNPSVDTEDFIRKTEREIRKYIR